MTLMILPLFSAAIHHLWCFSGFFLQNEQGCAIIDKVDIIHAGVVELADTTVLGAVTSVCRFKSCRPQKSKAYKSKRAVKKRWNVHQFFTALFWACPGGFEPSIFRVGVWCIIQLCYGQLLATHLFYHTITKNTSPFLSLGTVFFPVCFGEDFMRQKPSAYFV